MEAITIANIILFALFIITLISDILDSLETLYIFSFISLLIISLDNETSFLKLLGVFSHPVIILLACLSIFSYSFKKSKFLDITLKTFNKIKTPFRFLSYLLLFSCLTSSLLNNALVVSSLIPLIMEVSKRNTWPLQNFLMPLSFASMLGGTITTIGSSTNLVAISLLEPELTINILDLAKYSLPTALIGIIYLLVSQYIIQDDMVIPTCCSNKNKNMEVQLQFIRVEQGSDIIGKSVRDSQVQELYNLQLCGIQRGETFTALPPRSYTIIEKGDILTLIGFTPNRDDLQKIDDDNNNNLTTITKHDLNKITHPNIAIGMVPKYFSIINKKKCKEIGFKHKYHSILLCILRENEIINRDLVNQTIYANDFIIVHGVNSTDDVVSKLSKICNKVTSLSGNSYNNNNDINNKLNDFLLIVIFSSLIVNGFLKLTNISILCLVNVFTLLISGSINKLDIQASLKSYRNILLGTVSSLLLSKCLEEAGVLLIFSNITKYLKDFNSWTIYLLYHIIASILSILVSNVAVVSILIPIIKLSYLGSPLLLPISYCIIHGASCCFASPTGYHTNLMIHNIGNYKCRDYLKLGIPLHVLTSLSFSTIIYFTYS